MYINRDVDYMKWMKDKNLVVFSAGYLGKDVCRKFKKLGFHVSVFVDNSELKQRKNIYELPILFLEEVENKGIKSLVYIVPKIVYANEIAAV